MKDNQPTHDHALEKFPTYSMSDETQHRIHQQVMQALDQKGPQKNRKHGLLNRVKLGIITAAAITILSILSVHFLNTNTQTVTEEPTIQHEQPAESTPVTGSEEVPFDPAALEQQATTILQALDDRDMETLASHVHLIKGVMFSPYYSVSESTVQFDQSDVSTLLDDQTTYVWGYGEANTEIRLTPADYMEQHLQVERFFDSDEVLVDTPNPEIEYADYLQSVFPDGKIVEFYHAGTEQYSGLDWRSLNLVFEQDADKEWKLVAVINNLFTP